MKKTLFAIVFNCCYLQLFATNYFVSPAGDDDANGLSITTPFQTIERAAYAVSPGDTVFIRGGVYSKNYPESLIVFLTVSGTAENPITFKNYPGETPILQMNGTNWGAIKLNGCDYIIIDGLTIIGNNDNITLAYAQSQQNIIGNPATAGNGIMIDPEYQNDSNKPHHVIVRNCSVSKCGGGGIYTYGADYVTIENNTVFECAWYTPYGNSGISFYQSANTDTFPGVKNFIVGNTCYRNENFIPWYVTNSILDGNGIIIDDNRNTQNSSNQGFYLGKTYVANNLVFDNGGRAIHCFESDNVIVANNTCYKNCKSPTTRQGELTAINASNITFLNNIVNPNPEVPPIGQYEATAINATNNLFTANADLANPAGANTIIGETNFVNSTTNFETANFHLQQNSGAIGLGITSNAPIKDKDGIIRLANGTIDIGCYEFATTLKNISFESKTVKIYPNPTSETINIDLKDKITTNFEIVFYNAVGQQIKIISEITNQDLLTFNISELDSGIYFISKFEGKNETYLGKFVKN